MHFSKDKSNLRRNILVVSNIIIKKSTILHKVPIKTETSVKKMKNKDFLFYISVIWQWNVF